MGAKGDSSEQIPLNLTSSSEQVIHENDKPGGATTTRSFKHINNAYESAADEAERHLLSAQEGQNNKTESANKSNQSLYAVNTKASSTQRGRRLTNLNDINAMSVASIYDRENNDIMDADK